MTYFHSKKSSKVFGSHLILISTPSNIGNHHYWPFVFFDDFTVWHDLPRAPKKKGFSRSYALLCTDHRFTYFFFKDEFYVQYLLIDAIRPSYDASYVTKGGYELAFSKKPNISNDAKWSRTTHFTNLLKCFKEKSIMMYINQ